MSQKLILMTILAGTLFCTNKRPTLVDPIGGRTFWASKFEKTGVSPEAVPAFLAGVSANARIYVSVDEAAHLTDDIADAILTEFEKIAEIEHPLFTTPLDFNDDGRITLLLLDIKDSGLTHGGDAFIAGYFDPFNQFDDGQVYLVTCGDTSSPGCSRSNEEEILYLDTRPLINTPMVFYATMAHEYQHLLHFSRDSRAASAVGGVIEQEASWVNEGLSEVASDLAGYGPQTARLTGFKVTSGNSLTDWNFSNPINDYANTYVYFRFLTDVYGSSVLSKIFNSSKLDVAGVNEGLQNMADPELLSGCGSQQDATHPSFDCSFRYLWWSLYNHTSPIKGEKGGASISAFTPPAKFAMSAAHVPEVPSASSSNSAELGSYAVQVHTLTSGGALNSGAACSPSCTLADFTLLFKDGGAGGAGFVYNHNSTKTSTSKIGVTASVSASEGSQKSGPGIALCGQKPGQAEALAELPVPAP